MKLYQRGYLVKHYCAVFGMILTVQTNLHLSQSLSHGNALSEIISRLWFVGDSADLTNVIQANDEIATEINGIPLPAKSPNNVTSGSLDRNQCQDIYPSWCPTGTWACTHSLYITWMQKNCQKSCGWCSGKGAFINYVNI